MRTDGLYGPYESTRHRLYIAYRFNGFQHIQHAERARPICLSVICPGRHMVRSVKKRLKLGL